LAVTVVKVGGSLSKKPEALKSLCIKLGELAREHFLVVVPGGGEFADIVREADRQFSLSPPIAHRMAILGMDQYGMLLSDLIPNSLVFDSVDSVAALPLGKLAILLPSKLMLKDDPLENSWDVTSDSIAAYIAIRLGANQLLLVTDVDGIYSNNPKLNKAAKLIEKISPNQLLAMKNRTSVDLNLPKLLMKSNLRSIVINGFYPERIESALDGKKTVCTEILNSL
jgi:5-(aminomethyl)-3-furanmethanol phosphate kinase